MEIQNSNHLLPFFWQHGEDEATLREFVGVIQDAGCGAFCVESRPHPDFCGPKWWADMDAILDEAKKRGMKVWILDDSHFPTGYANGNLPLDKLSLRRRSLFARFITLKGKNRTVKLKKSWAKPPKLPMEPMQRMMMLVMPDKTPKVCQDSIYTVAAYGPNGECLDLSGKTEWDKPEGEWKLKVCCLSYDMGAHRSYINMMDRESCQVLLDAVYEPHYAHYRDYFGSTIAGFFSDEPELGNGILYAKHNKLGTEQDLPWSRELEALLKEQYGESLFRLLPCLFTEPKSEEEKAFRVFYMDCVSRLVSEDFSLQVGSWCRAHGVEYIGHTVEDDDTHACTGSGLGHFFRAMAGQDMAGIDDIGGQVLPQGEDEPTKAMIGKRNGAFYHFTLPKLGVSLAYLDEKKKGRTMCEIFGNYGWSLGVTDMKYLADHFMVNGVNTFVPHAFSPKKYPDPDCPPHFYAHGHNPQYRHFGALCRYMNRVCDLISGGRIVHDVAVYYNAESDWAGEADTLDKVARTLAEHQIDFCFLPLDLIDRAKDYRFVIVPRADYIPETVTGLPNAVFSRDYPGDELARFLRSQGIGDAVLVPENKQIRVLHYRKEAYDLYYFVNEGTDFWEGRISVPVKAPFITRYDAWEDQFYRFDVSEDGFALRLEPRKSVLLFLTEEEIPSLPPLMFGTREENVTLFERSVCRAVDYPRFGEKKTVTLPDAVEKELPKFSGFVRYEGSFYVAQKDLGKLRCLKITGLSEGVELFVNGQSVGLQIVPDYVFDLRPYGHAGWNSLAIECATTLARENPANPMMQKITGSSQPLPDTGIHGKVSICYA